VEVAAALEVTQGNVSASSAQRTFTSDTLPILAALGGRLEADSCVS